MASCPDCRKRVLRKSIEAYLLDKLGPVELVESPEHPFYYVAVPGSDPKAGRRRVYVPLLRKTFPVRGRDGPVARLDDNVPSPA